MKTITLRMLLREPQKVKRWTRTGKSVQVTDSGEPLWILQPFFFNDTATTEIYTLSLHHALPLSRAACAATNTCANLDGQLFQGDGFIIDLVDRKSTRLNSSHLGISYAVFCL